MIPKLMEHMPSEYGTYIEPFFGAGALFFHLEPSTAIIGDANPDLMEAYRVIHAMGSELAERVNSWDNNPWDYATVRSLSPTYNVNVASRFIYLNKLCVNGLWRVNKKGGFNVPYDHRRSEVSPIINGHVLDSAQKVLRCIRHSRIYTQSYELTTALAVPGDVVFMDPPYMPFTANGHVDYTSRGFTTYDHIKLCDEFKRLDVLGCRVILTNSDIPEVREMYEGYTIERVETKSTIKRTSNQGSYGELIISNRPKVQL